MSQIFISYRRTDSLDATGRIHDHLEMYFGPRAVFRDIDRLHGGAHFVLELEKALDCCHLAMVVIGDGWLDARDENGGRRLDDPNDYVRREIAAVLARRVHLLPVVVRGAAMPRRDQLPPEIARIADIQSVPVASGNGFRSAVRELGQRIHELTGIPFEDFRSVLTDCQEAGLVLLKPNFRNDLSVLEEMRRSEELLVVMNDGRGWLDQNSELIGERIRASRKRTRIVLLHPRSPFLNTLIQKNGKTKATQVEEIRRSFRILHRNGGKDSNLDVRGHFFFNPFTLTIGDRYAFVSPYFYHESGALPLFKLARSAEHGLYARYRSDAEQLFEGASRLKEDDFQNE